MHTLICQQQFRVPIEQLWQFISTPANLNQITPDFLRFSIVSQVPQQMFNGLMIEYRIKIPFLGYRRWITEIKHLEMYSFVDEQRIGPYRFWHHHHKLEENPQGTLMTDTVNYVLPYGFIGHCLHRLWVKRTLEAIFSYRKNTLDAMFNSISPQPS